MKQKRRKFLKGIAALGAVGAVGTWWASTSQRRSARWMRQIIADSRRRIVPAPVKPEPVKWSDNEVTICWIGHATVLINFYGVSVLTDPVFGNRIGISMGLGTAGPKRYIAPALKLKELPLIDVVLLSHAHMDHMDVPSLAKLKRSLRITAKSTMDIFGAAENVRELSWGDKPWRGQKGAN